MGDEKQVLTREKILERISECEEVIRSLKECKGLKIMQQDLLRNYQRLNDGWHRVYDDAKLNEIRATKMATDFVLNLVHSYEDNLKALQNELTRIDNAE